MIAKISIIILNWNQPDDTIECLSSLSALQYPNYEIILVDNGSTDGSPEKIIRLFPGIKLISNAVNLGFAEGNNIALKAALSQDCAYCLLLNNDTAVEPEFLAQLLTAFAHDPKIGIASPKIMFYQARQKIWFLGGRYYPLLKKPYHAYYGQPDAGQINKITEVDWVSGCCMLVKKEVYEKIGLLDKDYFNNYEDVDFCLRARRAGYKIVVVPQAKIFHKFAASLGGKFSPLYTYFRTRNNLLFFLKTGQWLPLILNFLIFPFYSALASIKRRKWQSLRSTFIALGDFLAGKYGIGSSQQLQRKMKNKTIGWWLLWLILLLAAAIRLHHPTFRSLWGDEAHSFCLAQQITSFSVYQTAMQLVKDSHLPVYFILLSAWMKIFGVTELALRSLSILIGCMGIIVFFFLSQKMFDRKTALISTFLLAISPLAVMHSQEIRMYGLLFFFSSLSSLYFWELVAGRKGSFVSAAWVVSTLLLLLTHIYGALILAAQFIFLLFNYWQERKVAAFVRLLFLQAISGFLALPLYLKALSMNLSAATAGTTDMAFSVFPWPLRFFLFFFVLSLGETVAPWNLILILPAGIVFGGLLALNFRWLRDKRIVYLLIMLLFPLVASSLWLKLTMPKYLIICLPYYLLLVGHSIAQIKNKAVSYGIILIIIIAQACSINNYFSRQEYHNSNQIEPWRKAGALIHSRYQKGDIVIASTHFVVYRLLNYYLNIIDQGAVPIYDLEQKRPTLASVQAPRIWLVTNIHDDRAFPPGSLEAVKAAITKNYSLQDIQRYVSYDSTLVAKLPINRHKIGSYRIELSLYKKRR